MRYLLRKKRGATAVDPGSSGPEPASGGARAGLESHGVNEPSFVTTESDKSSISNMQVWTAPQSQQPLQQYSASEGHQGARPPKRQRIDGDSSVLRADACSAQHSQQQPLPHRTPLQSGDVHMPAASSGSQHSMCQDPVREPWQTSGGNPSSSDAAVAAFLGDFVAEAAPGGTILEGNQMADLPSQPGQKCDLPSSDAAEEAGTASVPSSGGRLLYSSAHDAANPSMRTDMSQAAAVISSSLPGGLRGSSGAQPGPAETAHAVSKREIKRQGFVPVHGNYRRYYGYRIGQAFEEDPRLKVGYSPTCSHLPSHAALYLCCKTLLTCSHLCFKGRICHLKRLENGCRAGDGKAVVSEQEVHGYWMQRGHGDAGPCHALWHCQHAGGGHRPGPHQQSLQVCPACTLSLLAFLPLPYLN